MVSQKKLAAIGLLVPILVPMIYLLFVAFVSDYVNQGHGHWAKALRIFWILLAESYIASAVSIGPALAFLLRKGKGLAFLPPLSVGIAFLASCIAATVWPVGVGEAGVMLSVFLVGVNSILIVCVNGLLHLKGRVAR